MKIKAGILGGRSYTGGELIRILLHHPNIEITSITSSSDEEISIDTLHQDLLGQTSLKTQTSINGDEEVIFLCTGHGESIKSIENLPSNFSGKIIDLGNDFRLQAHKNFENKEFVYGLPELNLEKIKKAQYIANPGCFATAIQLAVLPLAQEQKLSNDIHISAITGSTGAGAQLSNTSHFSWRNNNISPYKTFTHQHLGEIQESLTQLQPNFSKEIHFLPYRGDFTRGIFATIYTDFKGNLEEAYQLYEKYYQDAVFVKISKTPIHLKQVVNTQYCFLHLEVINGKLIIHSIIDNLIKGAGGQAIQNLNIMMGWEENTGLNLKANYY